MTDSDIKVLLLAVAIQAYWMMKFYSTPEDQTPSVKDAIAF